ncbi:MAG: 1-deoxy-D-xylulose-5-phosphate reductoisomerase [Betaproteobacteria bacterium]|nr:1-deoxy-D-xylulose-5-phosphate reductoisomerase [Betaproteobacteria bacterium]
MTARNLCLLGATGSIGSNTLAVVDLHPERYRVMAVAAATSVDRMLEICQRHAPRVAVMTEEASANRLRERLRELKLPCEVLSGPKALAEIARAPDCDTVVAGIVGAAGLESTWAAVSAGKRVLLANKEALVMAGRLFMRQVALSGAQLLPIDSEHNAILQSLPDSFSGRATPLGVRRIILTASGGPFRTKCLSELASVTPREACAHPNWVMGRKISVDSATMLNKGLEVIEAKWLFDAAPGMIEVVVHPQSVIHSMVEYLDGSVLAQLSHPDMRIPIAHALAYPERVESGARYLDVLAMAKLEFEPPDLERFPCLGLAYAALHASSDAPIVLNAANEIAVQAFLDERVSFTQIPRIIEETMGRLRLPEPNTLEEVMDTDAQARREARRQVALLHPSSPSSSSARLASHIN